MIDRNNPEPRIQAIPDMQTAPKAHDAAPATIKKILQDLTLDEKRELLRKLKETGIPTAKYKAAER